MISPYPRHSTARHLRNRPNKSGPEKILRATSVFQLFTSLFLGANCHDLRDIPRREHSGFQLSSDIRLSAKVTFRVSSSRHVTQPTQVATQLGLRNDPSASHFKQDATSTRRSDEIKAFVKVFSLRCECLEVNQFRRSRLRCGHQTRIEVYLP